MKPTIRELLDMALGDDHNDALLAERVEAVLLIHLPIGTVDGGWSDGWKACHKAMIRALDGEQ